jgi:hypothetical protein
MTEDVAAASEIENRAVVLSSNSRHALRALERGTGFFDRARPGPRESQLRSRIGGHADLDAQLAGLPLPRHADLTVGRLMRCAGPMQPTAGMGRQHTVLESWPRRFGLETGHVPVEPIADGAKRIVVEGETLLEASIEALCVPRFLHAGGPLLCLVEPRRNLFLLEQREGEIFVSVSAEDVTEVGRRGEARAQGG